MGSRNIKYLQILLHRYWQASGKSRNGFPQAVAALDENRAPLSYRVVNSVDKIVLAGSHRGVGEVLCHLAWQFTHAYPLNPVMDNKR